jgi:peptidyl-prolyl cis-trans isomerase C
MKFLVKKNVWLILVGLSLIWPGFISLAETEELPKDKVAIVNGSTITRKDFDFELNQNKKRITRQGQNISDSQLGQIRKRTLENLINQELLYQESQKKGLKIQSQKVTERLASIKERFPDDAEFKQALVDMNLTEDDLKLKIQRSLAIEELIDKQIATKIVVTDQENKNFYESNPDFFKQPEQVKASHILIKLDPSADENQKAEAKSKIQAIQKKLKNGDDFANSAKEFSEGPSKVNGGDLGYFRRGQMVKPFEDAAFAMKPGEVSDIVETRFGYHLIKVTDKKPETTISHTEVKEKITQYLKQEKQNEKMQIYIQELREQAQITKYL